VTLEEVDVSSLYHSELKARAIHSARIVCFGKAKRRSTLQNRKSGSHTAIYSSKCTKY